MQKSEMALGPAEVQNYPEHPVKSFSHHFQIKFRLETL